MAKKYKYKDTVALEKALQSVHDNTDPEVLKEWQKDMQEQGPKVHRVKHCADCPFKYISSAHAGIRCHWDANGVDISYYVERHSRPQSCPLNKTDILCTTKQ